MADERNRAMQTGSDATITQVYAHGVADGNAAAAADSPRFLGYQLLLGTAWETSRDWLDGQPLPEQEEYFVAWVHGYMGRVDELEGTLDTWEEAVP